MKLTEEQRLAIETEDRALLVEAGAGTGKTAVLVQRFLHLLDRHPDWPLESIVAVTFTEKAAREMRARIRQEVEKKASQAPFDAIWQERRRNLDRLMVNTIHGFCARLLRENAIAAQVDPRFQVLEETEADLLKEEALRQTFAELGAAETDDAALDLLASLRVRDLEEEMMALLGKRDTVGQLFAQLADPPTLLARWREGVAQMQAAVWRDLQRRDPDLAAALEELPRVSIIDPTDALAETVRLAQDGCRCVRAGDLAGGCKLWAEIKRGGGKQGNWGGKEGLAELKESLKSVQDAGKEMVKEGCTLAVGPEDEQAAQSLQQWRALWDKASGVYERLKAERQSLDFDDLEILAERLLCREDRDPRLIAFLSAIHHVMVDEFQDTNEIQQRIIYALADPRDAGRLFVVGDAKQSIYRFRQAQASVFRRTSQDIQAATGQAPLPLSRSFRAHEALVKALNCVFDQIFQPLGDARADYEAPPGPLTAERATPDAQPIAPAAVEFWLAPEQDDQGNKVAMEDARIYEAQLLARRLVALQDGGFRVWDKRRETYRPFRYSDAAILFRATTSLPLYEEQFKAEGLPYLTISGRGYYDRPEVRDLTALLACLRAPGDDLSLATVLRSPLFALSDETLYRLRWRLPEGQAAAEAIPYAQALQSPPPTGQAERVIFAAKVLRDLWAMTGRVEVWELLREALDRTGYEAALALSDFAGGGGRQRSNVLKFMTMARERGGVSVSDFLLRVQDLRDREAREGEALASDPESGAVQLMSIHAAKGLEFPVVAVADLGRGRGGSRGSPLVLHDPAFGLVCQQRDANGDWQKPASYLWGKWFDGRMEEAENKRLLYVACTRAADLLILSGRKGEKGCWLEDLLQAWQINDQGEQIELGPRQGYAVAVHPPAQPPEEARAEAEGLSTNQDTGQLSMQEMPALAMPLLAVARSRPTAVTDLLQRLAEEEGELPMVRPAVRVDRGDHRVYQAPRYLIGNVVHRVLADWDCLVMPAEELSQRLATYAQREGIVSRDSLRHAVTRASALLDNLRHSRLFQEISESSERHSEVPFTLQTPLGPLHGIIDLLYRDRQGRWTLVDWKTEWIQAEQMAERVEQHRLQVAVYAMAAQQALGTSTMPRSMLCFLGAEAATHEFTENELLAAWQQVSGQSGHDLA